LGSNQASEFDSRLAASRRPQVTAVLNSVAWRLAIAAFLLLGTHAYAMAEQEDSCLNRTVPVNVFTREGLVGEGLTAADFRGKYRGKPVEIVSATRVAKGIRIVLLLDTSESMWGNASGSLQFGIEMIRNLVRSAPNGTSFALLTFASHVEDRVEFGRPPESLQKELDALATRNWGHYKGAGRRTALFDSLLAALDLLQPPRPGDVIFLASDGGENASQNHESRVVTGFLTSGTRLFLYLTASPPQLRMRTPVEAFAPSTIVNLTDVTGGESFPYPWSDALMPHPMSESQSATEAREQELLPSLARSVMREIFGFYSLQIKLPKRVDKVREWNLEAVGPAGKRNLFTRVVYPRLLAPCQ